jgi:hypothetical protein
MQTTEQAPEQGKSRNTGKIHVQQLKLEQRSKMERRQLLGEYKQVENPSFMFKRRTQKADKRL